MRLHLLWLIATGAASAITLFAPIVATIAATTVIGIPIALALMVAPVVFMMSLGSFIIGHTLMMGRAGYLIGAGVALVVLALPPLYFNAQLEERAASLVEKDRDTLKRPLRAKTLAVRRDDNRFSRHEAACDGVCMRALLNGVAMRFLYVEQDVTMDLDPTTEARSYRFERRSSCPALQLNGNDELRAKEQRRFEEKSAIELMQLEIAKGNCLIEELVPLGQADTVLTFGSVHKGKTATRAGLDPAADTVSAYRLSVHERSTTGFVEAYRRTSVVTQLLLPIFAPTVGMEAELRTFAVLARSASGKNLDSPYANRPDWAHFLTEKLGLDLALRDNGAETETRQVLASALAKAGNADPGAVKLAEDFIDGISRRKKMSSEDYPLALSVLTDNRFTISWQAWAAVRYATDADSTYFDAIGASMFQRLSAIAAADDPTKYPTWKEESRPIAKVILDLPAATILKHRADLDWLAKQERLRVYAHSALVRLHEFGSDAGPTLLALMKEAAANRERYQFDWVATYAAGLAGLCRMGADGKAMIKPIFEGLDSGTLPKTVEWQTMIQTLVNLGADPDDIWEHVKSDDRNHSAKNFGWAVARAKKDGRRRCELTWS
jgi:hypothetical protein